MANNENLIPIPGRLHSVATEGHVAGANEIIDDETGLTLDKVAGGALEEKEHTSGSDNGLGRVVLRKNLVNGVNTLVQTMINKSNTIYVIQYDFTLGENITIPANCVLEFDGGSIYGEHILTLQETLINGNAKFYCRVSGSVKNDKIFLSWGNGEHWINDAFDIAKYKTIIFEAGKTYDLKFAQDINASFVIGNNATITINNVSGNIGGESDWVFGHLNSNYGTDGKLLSLYIENLNIKSTTLNGVQMTLSLLEKVYLKNVNFDFANKNDLTKSAHCLDFQGGIGECIIEDCTIKNHNVGLSEKGSTLWFRNIRSDEALSGYGDITIVNNYIYNKCVDETLGFIQNGYKGKILVDGNNLITDFEGVLDASIHNSHIIGSQSDAKDIIISNNTIYATTISTYAIRSTTYPIKVNNNTIEINGIFKQTNNGGRYLFNLASGSVVNNNTINVTISEYINSNYAEYYITAPNLLNNTITLNSVTRNAIVSGGLSTGNVVNIPNKGAIALSNIEKNNVYDIQDTDGIWSNIREGRNVIVCDCIFNLHGNRFGLNISANSYIYLINNIFNSATFHSQGDGLVIWKDNVGIDASVPNVLVTSDKTNAALAKIKSAGINILENNVPLWWNGSAWVDATGATV